MKAHVAALAPQAAGPLAGILVLELCGDEPSGTFGTQILGDLGATVVKLERLPTGTPVATDPSAPMSRDLAYFWGLNRNKLSASIDLKNATGRELLHALARVADVIYDNFRPEVMKRIGADAATLRATNPELICCSVTGFGRSGPLAGEPAYDVTVQGLGGGMSLTGSADPASMPIRCGNPIGGIGGALYGVVGVLAALARRRREGTGATLDLALLDIQLAMHAYRVPPALGAGVRFGPTPHRGGTGALPYGPFRAACGGWFALGITRQFWSTFCTVVGHPEWAEDPRFFSEQTRQQNEEVLNTLVAAAVVTRTAEDWQARFIEAGIPGAPVRSIREAFDHPHVAMRNMLPTFDHPVGRHVHVGGNPVKLSSHPEKGMTGAPGLGEHTQAVLTRLLNLPDERVLALRRDGVVWWPDNGRVYRRPSVV